MKADEAIHKRFNNKLSKRIMNTTYLEFRHWLITKTSPEEFLDFVRIYDMIKYPDVDVWKKDGRVFVRYWDDIHVYNLELLPIINF